MFQGIVFEHRIFVGLAIVALKARRKKLAYPGPNFLEDACPS